MDGRKDDWLMGEREEKEKGGEREDLKSLQVFEGYHLRKEGRK